MDHGSGYSNPHWKADSCLIKKDPFNVPARGLNIVWGNDSRYWQWNKIKEEERKIQAEEVAVLLQVNWLEVTGKIDLNNSFVANKAYTIYYVIKFEPMHLAGIQLRSSSRFELMEKKPGMKPMYWSRTG
ncbi:F-box protein PP2-B11 [Camellia lanceoleosa]|uniref:F-box protein PP2-B11 n=1 Tax=Camellia lanceoleosa TaxID=1840588 RepID=A0ACC0GL30_9ERIC|nr:F-box protein PP2-B11 [Camellia lanceoleosa]